MSQYAKCALVVDDSRAMRLIVGRAITKFGFDVLEAADGRQALEVLARNPCDLVLVDCNMPVMDGFALVDALRRQPLFAYIRIVMITATADLAHIDEALAAGADDFIMKPFTTQALHDKLQLLGLFPKRVDVAAEDNAS
jgi:two-component system, chemotaxis family, chemotaxis protein CheY